MFYITNNNVLEAFADYKFSGDCKETNILTVEELEAEPFRAIVQEGDLVLNPNYEEEKAQKEAERVGNLKCTKRVFVLMLEKMGLDYFEQIEPLINNNRQAKLEWELCVELERSNNLLDILATELGVTSRQLDLLFQYANGEDVELEVING
jgi:hypothetical protein